MTAVRRGMPATGSARCPQADRGGVRLGQGASRARKGEAARKTQGRGGLHPAVAAYNLIRLPKLLAQASV